jgi:hypothetical protein
MEALARVALLIVVLIVLLGVVVGASEYLHPVATQLKVADWIQDQERQAAQEAQDRDVAAQDAASRADFRTRVAAGIQQAITELGATLSFGIGVVLGVAAAALAVLLALTGARVVVGRAPLAPPTPPAPAQGAQTHRAAQAALPQAPLVDEPAPQAAYFHRTPYPAPHGVMNGNGAHDNGTHDNGFAPVVVFLAGHRNRSTGGAPGRRAMWKQAATRGRGTRRSYRKAADLEDDYRSHYGH